MAEDQFEYIDTSLTDKVVRLRRFYNDVDETTLEQERSDEIPEEIMSQIEEFVGDGLAKVTVAADLGSSVSFHSAKSFVSVSVSCNNDMDSIAAVHDIIRPYTQQLCFEDHAEMAAMRDSLLSPGQGRQQGGELPTKVAQPPKRGGTAPKRGGKTITPKGVKKPNFRR